MPIKILIDLILFAESFIPSYIPLCRTGFRVFCEMGLGTTLRGKARESGIIQNYRERCYSQKKYFLVNDHLWAPVMIVYEGVPGWLDGRDVFRR